MYSMTPLVIQLHFGGSINRNQQVTVPHQPNVQIGIPFQVTHSPNHLHIPVSEIMMRPMRERRSAREGFAPGPSSTGLKLPYFVSRVLNCRNNTVVLDPWDSFEETKRQSTHPTNTRPINTNTIKWSLC